MIEQLTAYCRSPLGLLEVIGSEIGISSLLFVDDVDAEANISIPPCLENCVAQLNEYFQGTRKEFSLALNLQGSDFQKKVWQQLLKIPFGKTVSYLDIALALGDRKKIRAVGGANGSNPVCIIVPCHRVIGANGSLIGYGGGLWRKQWLLSFENRAGQGSIFEHWNAEAESCRAVR